MKTLILMRHAKSDWTMGRPDHARPLNPRGQRSARAMGAWLRGAGFVPDAAIVSPARRTRETFDTLALEVPARYEAALYEASEQTLLHCVQQARGETVLMVAHNPGVALLAHGLVATAPQHDRWHDMPTAATLVVRFDVETWAQVQRGTGDTLAFVTPHDLAGAEG